MNDTLYQWLRRKPFWTRYWVVVWPSGLHLIPDHCKFFFWRRRALNYAWAQEYEGKAVVVYRLGGRGSIYAS